MIWVYIIGAFVVLIGASAFFGAPYVPSRRRDVQKMFDNLYPLSENDVLFDAGSGDGLVLREASRRGAKAIGYEINPAIWLLGYVLSARSKNVSTYIRNFWVTPFPDDVTFIYTFSVSRDSKRLVQHLEKERRRLDRPFKVVCYGSPLPGVKPLQQFEAYSLYQF